MGKAIKTIEDLRPNPSNSNRGTPRGHGIIEHSVRQRGAGRSGLAANDGTMIAGNQTLQKMMELGIPVRPIHTNGKEWVVVIRDDIEPGSEDARLLGIEDNRASELGLSYDPAVFASLKDDLDLSHLFSTEEMAALLEGLGESVDEGADDAPPVIDEDRPTRVQPGDVWRVGGHIVACLDSTDRGNVERIVALADGRPSFVVADPPYGIDIVATDGYVGGGEKYDYPFGGVKNRPGLGAANGAKPFGSKKVRGSVGAANLIDVGKYMPVIGDDSTDTAVDAALLILDLFPKAVQFWWGANNYAHALPPSTCWIVWDKENTGNFADAELAWSNHEGAVRIFRHMWNGMLRASEHGRRVHPTQKPAALFDFLYSRYGKPGDLILDPFLGSGPSLKAAHRMGDRRVVGFELSPHYCTHIIEWAESNGLSCSLAASLTCERQPHEAETTP